MAVPSRICSVLGKYALPYGVIDESVWAVGIRRHLAEWLMIEIHHSIDVADTCVLFCPLSIHFWHPPLDFFYSYLHLRMSANAITPPG